MQAGHHSRMVARLGGHQNRTRLGPARQNSTGHVDFMLHEHHGEDIALEREQGTPNWSTTGCTIIGLPTRLSIGSRIIRLTDRGVLCSVRRLLLAAHTNYTKEGREDDGRHSEMVEDDSVGLEDRQRESIAKWDRNAYLNNFVDRQEWLLEFTPDGEVTQYTFP
ncbi:hypothetical protein GQ600_27269 [Phytophthora cactorum]|nr:hypothetical protein GQ600_27269 [Phytophthora cactorum]